MLMALKPIHDLSPIKEIVVSTYQAVSGAGKEGMEELTKQVEAIVNGEEPQANYLPVASLDTHYQIAYNLIPQIDVFLDNDYTKEEMKMVNEVHKVLHDDTIAVSPTTVRVPVMRSHAMSVRVKTEKPLEVAAVREVLSAMPGVVVCDDPQQMQYPMPLDTSFKNDVSVGRLRKDLYDPNALNLWISGDQIRKGAALNTLQIAEYILENDLL